jgi:hypothetical protein
MRVMRSIGSLALLTLLLCSSVGAQGGNPQLVARWTIYHVSGVGQGTWSAWYAQGPYPVHFRFKCSNGSVIVNAQNTDKLTQGVTVRYWDVERDQGALESAIGSKKALQNRGFALQARQSTLQPIIRPDACSAASNSFVFGAYLGV